MNDNSKRQAPRPSIGALFANKKRKHPKAPILCGTIKLQHHLIEQLLELYETSEEMPSLSISAWKNFASETEEPYLTLKVDLPFYQSRDATTDSDVGFRFLDECN